MCEYHGMPLDARVRLAAATKCALDMASDNLALLVSDAVHAGRGASEATTRMADVLTDLRPLLQKLRTVSALLPHEQMECAPDLAGAGTLS